MKRLIALALLLVPLGGAQIIKAPSGARVSGSFTTTCIPKAVTAVTLQCSPLFAVDANTVAQANSTTAQTFILYSTVDSVASPTNSERMKITYSSGAAAWQVSFEKTGTGTARGVDFGSGGNYSFLNGVGGSRSFIISAAGKLITYGQVVSNDAVVTRGTNLASTAQTASLGATNVLTGGAATAGLYRVCYQASTTTSGTGTTGTVTIAWNDGNAKSFTTGTWALNAVDITGQVNGCQVFRVANSQNITVATTIGAIGTSVYRVDASAEQLQ